MIIDEITLKESFKGNVLETSALLRVSVQTVMASLKKYDITFDKPKHIYSELKKTDFSDFQKGLLIGSILGDGHLEKRKHLKNATFREEHSIDQIEWLKWKHSNLKPFTTSNLWVRDSGKQAFMPDGCGGKKLYAIKNVCAFSTGGHPYLTKLHKLFYEKRIKVVPKDFLSKNFNLVSLAVLIGDDGNFSENSLRICTDSFTREEVEFLSKLCSVFYKGRITLREEKPGKYRIAFTYIRKDLNFFRLMKDILPPCMHHKVTPVLNEHQTATH